MALTDSLVSYYKLDESSGDASDSVGSNTLTNVNTATFVTGKINNCCSLSGASQAFDKAGNYGIAFGSSYSIGGWVRLNAEIGASTWQLFSLCHSATNADISVITYDYNSGTRRLRNIRYNSGAVDTEPTYNITLGTTDWYHIFITYDSGTARMDTYVNGTSVVNATSSNTAGTSGSYVQGFYLGRYGDGGASITNSKIDEVGVWSRCLSSTEISQLYNSGLGLAYPFGASSSPLSNLALLGVG